MSSDGDESLIKGQSDEENSENEISVAMEDLYGDESSELEEGNNMRATTSAKNTGIECSRAVEFD